MANKNFKARIGIEAPLIAADNGTTAITLDDNDVTVVGDLTITSNTIKSSTGATALTLSTNDVTVADRLFVVGNIIGSNGGYTALTFNQEDVKVEGDLTVGGNDIKSSTNVTAITLTGANVILPGTLDVQGGTITESTGALSITTGGAFTSTGSSISGTTLTIGTLVTGTISLGQSLIGGTTLTGTVITANISGSGSGSTWTVSRSQTVASSAINGAGDIALAPITTGDVSLTFANGGNLINNRNYVYGSIRNATTEANGDVWSFISGAGGAYRGVTIDNSIETTKRSGLILRSYGISGGAPRTTIINEVARGTAATPANLNSGDSLMEITGTGYVSTGFIGDLVGASPAAMRFVTTEAYNTGLSNVGARFQVTLQPAATTLTGSSPINVISAAPETFNTRSDSYSFNNKANTASATLDSTGNLVLTGNLRVNGNNILASTGATAITLSGADVAVAGDLRVNGNDILSSTGATALTLSGGSASTPGNFTTTGTATYNNNVAINAITRINPSSSASGTQVNIKTEYRNTVSDPLVVPQPGYDLGNFRFQSYSDTADTYVLAGSVACQATENWTSTANGSKIIFQAVKQGKAWNDSSFNSVVIDTSPNATTFSSDSFTFNTSAASATKIIGNKIDYNRVYGAFQYNTTVTPAAANTAYVFPIGTVDFANIVSVGSTSRIIIGAAGIYDFQFSVQLENTANQEHVAYIWLRKNGADVSASMGRITVIKSGSTIAGWNYVINSANTTDYYELAYAVDNTAVIFPTYAATAFGPSTASLITTITPIGA